MTNFNYIFYWGGKDKKNDANTNTSGYIKNFVDTQINIAPTNLFVHRIWAFMRVICSASVSQIDEATVVDVEEVDVLERSHGSTAKKTWLLSRAGLYMAPVSEIPLSFLLRARQVGRSTGLDNKVLNIATWGRIVVGEWDGQ
jgi:hypothetical protein